MGNEGTTGPTHTDGTRKGEEIRNEDGQEPGRQDLGESHAGLAAGTKTARDSTGINPDDREAVDAESPDMPPA